MRRPAAFCRLGVTVALAVGCLVGCTRADAPTRIARDPFLRSQPLFLYEAMNRAASPRALIFFFGNDIGFWEPHRRLAASLARSEYTVAGLDILPLLRSLPDCGAGRDSAFAHLVGEIIARARHELRADSIPLIIGGHSLGAELAIWTAAHVAPPGTVGVLALSPGSRSHLRVSMSDVMNGAEPTEPESFSVADAISAIPSGVRVAIVRGTRDMYARADTLLLRSGGNRIDRFPVPFAGHSLKSLAVASLQTRRALNWLLTGH